jgi:hypothetical protein
VDGLRWLTFEEFEGREGESFEIVADGATVELTLGSAVQRDSLGGAGPDGTSRRQFSLEFLGPPEHVLAQATYPLTHAELGALDIFLVPLGPAANGAMRYEAAFA